MGDVTRALSGLEDFEVTDAVETAAGGLEVSVRVGRARLRRARVVGPSAVGSRSIAPSGCATA